MFHHYCQPCDAFTFHTVVISSTTGMARSSERCPLCMTSAANLPTIEADDDPQLRRAYWQAYHSSQSEAARINKRLCGIPIVDDAPPIPTGFIPAIAAPAHRKETNQ